MNAGKIAAALAALSLLTSPLAAAAPSASRLSVADAVSAERAGPTVERGNRLAGGSVIAAILAAAIVAAGIYIAVDDDDDEDDSVSA